MITYGLNHACLRLGITNPRDLLWLLTKFNRIGLGCLFNEEYPARTTFTDQQLAGLENYLTNWRSFWEPLFERTYYDVSDISTISLMRRLVGRVAVP